MILLEAEEPAGLPVFAIFGVGLIGSALVASLEASRRFNRSELLVSWDAPDGWQAELASVEHDLESALARNPGASLCVVWSAGRAGFGSLEDEARRELDVFRAVTDWLRTLAQKYPRRSFTLAVLSSAGGLFEGQRIVDSRSQPSPRRPYGLLKLEQERLAQAADAPWVGKLFRLTSVYGFIRPDQRMGLVSTMLRNGIRQERTRITGRMDTLRDFVWIEDACRGLTDSLLRPEELARPSVCILASCRPSSLDEVQQLVQRTLGRRIYVSYSLMPSNEVDITFSRDVLPQGFEVSDLRSNIVRIHQDALQRGTALGGSGPPLLRGAA